MSIYNDAADLQWKPLPTPFSKRCDGSAAVLKNKDGGGDSAIGVIWVGGRSCETGQAVNTVELLEWKLMKWWKLAPLITERSGCAVATIQDTVYVVGGCTHRHPSSPSSSSPQQPAQLVTLATVEQWTLGSSSGSWEELAAPMNTPRWLGAAVGMPKHGLLIVLGGRDATTWQTLKSVEAYDVKRQTWIDLPSMSIPRFGCAVVAIAPNRIMVMGGYDGRNILNSYQIFDLDSEEWTELRSMPRPMSFCSATTVTLDTRYVLVTGRTTTTNDSNNNNNNNNNGVFSNANNIIQCYCVKSRKWKILTTSEMIEPGPILSIGDDLICIGHDSSTERRENAICRFARWADIDLQQQRWWNGDEQSLLSEDVITAPSTSLAGSRLNFSSSNNVGGGGGGGGGDYTSLGGASSSHHHRSANPSSFSTLHRDSSLGSLPPQQQQQPQQQHHINAVVIPHAELITDERQTITIQPNHYVSAAAAAATSTVDGREIRQVKRLRLVDLNGKAAVYEGDVCVRTNKPHGKGRMTWEVSREVYDGDWLDGQRHGFGLTTFANGDSYEGNYERDKKWGLGTYSWRDGRKYQGQYVDDYRQDTRGVLTWKEGTKYEGQFVRGQRQGQGRMDFPDGVAYEGEFMQGKYEGFGTCRFRDGKIYKGLWKAGQADGQGTLTDVNGDVLYHGLWERDAPVMDR